MVTVNGEGRSAAGMTVEQLLASEGYESGRIAVELNGDIVPKSRYAATELRDGDTVEVVRFVGGG